VNAGSLDRRVTIEYKVVTQESTFGTDVITWTTLVSRAFAQITDSLPSKSESMAGDLQIGSSRARLRMRYLAGVKSDMRVIVHGSSDRTYQIVAGPAEIGRREAIEMMIEEYTS